MLDIHCFTPAIENILQRIYIYIFLDKKTFITQITIIVHNTD